MNKRLKFVLGGSGIALAVLYLIATGMTESAAYYLTVAEAADAVTNSDLDRVRVKGTVRHGSIERNAKDLRLSFALTDEQQQIAVIYHGIVPDLFAEGREVIVEGRFSHDVLVAESILASCPSKYEAQAANDAHVPP